MAASELDVLAALSHSEWRCSHEIGESLGIKRLSRQMTLLRFTLLTLDERGHAESRERESMTCYQALDICCHEYRLTEDGLRRRVDAHQNEPVTHGLGGSTPVMSA